MHKSMIIRFYKFISAIVHIGFISVYCLGIIVINLFLFPFLFIRRAITNFVDIILKDLYGDLDRLIGRFLLASVYFPLLYKFLSFLLFILVLCISKCLLLLVYLLDLIIKLPYSFFNFLIYAIFYMLAVPVFFISKFLTFVYKCVAVFIYYSVFFYNRLILVFTYLITILAYSSSLFRALTNFLRLYYNDYFFRWKIHSFLKDHWDSFFKLQFGALNLKIWVLTIMIFIILLQLISFLAIVILCWNLSIKSFFIFTVCVIKNCSV